MSERDFQNKMVPVARTLEKKSVSPTGIFLYT